MNLLLTYNEDTRRVTADLSNSGDDDTDYFNKAYVVKKLEEAGFGDYTLREGSISELLEHASHNKPCKIEIAEQVDSELSLDVDEESMYVTLTATKAHGGLTCSAERIKKELEKLNVTHGILDETLAKVEEAGEADSVVIARGQDPACLGEVTFEYLLDNFDQAGPSIDEQGNADLKNIHSYPTIDPGTPVMRRHPPEDMQDGFDVFGRTIQATVPNMPDFNDQGEGTIVDPNDENLLLAEVKGHPVFIDQGVRIDAVLTLPAVNINSGNIDYDGSILVKGDIEPDFIIKSTGDITVEGLVIGSNLQAEGNINVKQGIIGGQGVQEAEKTINNIDKKRVKILCNGNVTAAFIDNAYIHCKGDIAVSEYICHSILETSGNVFCGIKGGKGNIFGGMSRAKKNIKAKLFGSKAFVKTNVCVGVEPKTIERHNDLSEMLTAKFKQIKGLNHIVTEIEQQDYRSIKNEIKLKRLENLKRDSQQKIQEIEEEISLLEYYQTIIDQELAESENSQITVLDKAFP